MSGDLPTVTAGSSATRLDVRSGNPASDPASASDRHGTEVVEQEAGVYRDPGVGPTDLAGNVGVFTPRQLTRVDEALNLGSQETGLLFSLYIGELAEPTRAGAEALAAKLPGPSSVGVVLLAVSPAQRVLHIVTARGATKRLPNRVCALAALGMRASFAGGDLTAGVINGLRMLADAAGGEPIDTAKRP